MAEKYKIHPYCEIFPDITGEEYEELKADIAANGLQNPIWRWGVQILDGKNRLRVCQEIKLTPEFRDWRPSARARDGGQHDAEALQFVISQNLHRRQLNESQRSMAAAKISGLRKGSNQHSDKNRQNKPENEDGQVCTSSTVSDAAAAMNVSERSVKTAREVIDKGSEALQEAVETGAVAVSDAAKIVDLPKSEQTAAVNAVKAGKARTVAQAARQESEPTAEPEAPKDASGNPVPKKFSSVFEKRSDFLALARQLTDIEKKMSELADSDAGKYAHFNAIKASLSDAKRHIKGSAPHSICPYCKGTGKKKDAKCDGCKGAGWVNEGIYKQAPSDVREAS